MSCLVKHKTFSATRRTINAQLFDVKMMRVDKAKITDEVWDDDRVKSFLDKGPLGDEPADYSKLLHAYRSMRPEDFGRFLKVYSAAGGQLDAVDKEGRTLAQVIQNHSKAQPFLALLPTP
jgi:hypothetical protein